MGNVLLQIRAANEPEIMHDCKKIWLIIGQTLSGYALFRKEFFNPSSLVRVKHYLDAQHTFSKNRLFSKKLVLGQPNGWETFSTQATEVKKLILFFLSYSYYNFEETVTNFEKDMFGKVSLTSK